MNHTQHHQNRHGAGQLQTNRYSDLEIEAFNAEHDRRYGFDQGMPTVYQDVRRLPESVFVPASKCWGQGIPLTPAQNQTNMVLSWMG